MRWLLVALLSVLSSPLGAQQAPPAIPLAGVIVRQNVDPQSGAVIGQHVALYVDVLFRGQMPRPPRVDAPDVPGIQTFRFETQGTTMRETVAGEPYVGQRFEFAVYARRGGTFDMPPATVTLLDRQGEVTGTAQGEAVRIDIEVPAGIDPSQPVVATRSLTLNEQWEPNPGGAFKGGDALVRTITRSAEDVPGLAMRDLTFAAPEGARVYIDPPGIDDRSNRGIVTGRRIDRVTYVFERDGTFALPAVRQPWWDLAASVVKNAEAGGATVKVAAAPASAPAGTAVMGSRTMIVIAAGAALLLVLAIGAMMLRRHAHRDVDPEREAFDALRRACTSSGPVGIYQAFSRWIRILDPAQREAAAGAAGSLEAALFGSGGSDWVAGDAADLMNRLKLLRRARPPPDPSGELPPLNP